MNQLKNLTLTIIAIVAALGCFDTLRAQTTLTVATNPPTSPVALAFNGVPANGISQPQNLYISWNSGATGTAVITANQNWIVTPSTLNFNSTPSVLPVRVNTQGLIQGAPYSGTLTVTVSGQSALQQTVNVTVSVSGASALSANPSTLSFSAQQGSGTATPSSSTVQIASSGAVLTYSITPQTQTGGNWLELSATSGTSGDAGFQVFTNPQGLTAGTYTGSIIVQSSTSGDSVQIPVTLTVNASATLTTSPSNPAPILWQTGTPDPGPLQLNVTSSSGTTTFTAALNPNVAWLQLSAFGGSTPGSVMLIPKPAEANLTPATYTASVVFNPGGVAVPITLIAAAHPLIQLSANSLAYSAQFGATTPPSDQTVQVTASDGSKQGFAFASDSAWLTATTGTNFSTSGTSTTAATLTIRVNPAGQPLGSSTGTIKITPTNGDTYTQTIAVTLNLTAASVLQAGPQALLFSYETGQSLPGAQLVSVVSTGQPISFTVTPSVTAAANCPANWLAATASGAATPATVTITAPGISGMGAGLCSGAVTLSYTSSTGTTNLTINVTAAVSAANKPELVVNMPAGFGLETAQVGAQPFTRTISLTSTSLSSLPDFQALVTSSTGGAWLAVSPNTGNAPAPLTVTISPGVLTNPGVYNGTIQISSSTIPNYQLTVPVTLTLTSNVSVAVSPTSLTFAEAQGGPLPAAQTLTLASTGGTASFTSSIQYSTGNNWLQISPASGSASGPIQVSIAANTLSQGQYTAQILLTLVGASQPSLTIPVTLNVGPAQTVTASVSSLNFAYQINGATPASQKITLTSTGGPVAFTVGTTTTSGGSWLSTDIPSSGSTTGSTGSKDINVSVNTQGLAVGTYNGSISISAPGVLASPIAIPVQLVVTAQAAPQPTTVQNAASYVATYIAPGELITIKGLQLGPATGVSFALNASGGVDPTLAGVQVLFGGVPGTPIYVSATQINVIAPWEIGGQLSTNVVVSFNNVQSAAIPLAVAAQSPGLFTSNQQGTGQLSAINQNGTYNGVSGAGIQPAPQGSVISVFGTGGGHTNPPGVTGSVTPVPKTSADLLTISGATATVGGVPATVQFAGAAPGLVTGVLQMNIVVPNGVTGNAVPVTISINGTSTTQVTTIAVQ